MTILTKCVNYFYIYQDKEKTAERLVFFNLKLYDLSYSYSFICLTKLNHIIKGLSRAMAARVQLLRTLDKSFITW